MTSARFIVFSYLYLVKEQFFVLQINSKKFTSWKNKQAKRSCQLLIMFISKWQKKQKKKTTQKTKGNSICVQKHVQQQFSVARQVWAKFHFGE